MLFKQYLLTAVAAMAILRQSPLLANELIELPQPTAAETLVHEFMLDGRGVTLRLEANPEPFRRLEAAALSSMHAGGNRFFRGVLSGVDDSWARLSWVSGRWSGAIFDGGELFLLGAALSREAPGQDARDDAPGLIAYRVSELESDAIDFGHDVGVGGGELRLPRHHDLLSKAGALVGGRLPITIVSDTQFSSKHGSNALAVVASRINAIDGVLSADVGTGLLLMHHEILASNETLTANTCFELRQQFEQYFVDGNGSDIPFAGVVQLFTGRQMTGTVGCARSTSFGPCTRAFSLGVAMDMPQEWQSIAVAAHELGHTLGAPHDAEPGSACAHEPAGKIMASDGGVSLTYSACSVGIMQERLGSAGCVIQPWFFRDGFETPR